MSIIVMFIELIDLCSIHSKTTHTVGCGYCELNIQFIKTVICVCLTVMKQYLCVSYQRIGHDNRRENCNYIFGFVRFYYFVMMASEMNDCNNCLQFRFECFNSKRQVYTVHMYMVSKLDNNWRTLAVRYTCTFVVSFEYTRKRQSEREAWLCAFKWIIWHHKFRRKTKDKKKRLK